MEESANTEIQLATASRNNEDQNTQKEEKKNDELVIEIREIVEKQEIQIQSSTQCRIYKVPHPLRKWNEEAYTPQVVSIGPFHHKNKRLKAMEEHKERYFRSFVKRSAIKLEDLVGIIREMEESIRGCYEETINLNSDRFVKMILVDASFILELFFRHRSNQKEDDTMPVQLRSKAIILDFLLLENQLPFFVIEKLYNLASPSHSKDHGLLELSFDYFGEFNNQNIAPDPNVKIEHFTDLLRTFQIPPLGKRPERGYQQNDLLYTATQLDDAGVKFEVVKESECLFEIKFEKGVLKMPRLKLNKETEVIARNIIALEQICYKREGYFTDYFIFMDLLIKTTKDVDLFCVKKIFLDYVGDRFTAESMINNLNKGILGMSMRTDYVDLCKELNGFYDKPWHKWRAVVKNEFFSTPLQSTKTILTIFVITVLTWIQTFSTIWGLKDSN